MPELSAFTLLMLFYVLLVIEFFVPSGGIIGIAAAVAAIGSITVGFTQSFMTGLTYMGVVTFTTPILFVGMVRIWPKTALGKQMLNRRPGQIDSGAVERTTASGRPFSSLMGETGIAVSDLLPSGVVQIAGDKVDVVCVSGAVNSGDRVRVVEVESGRVRVQKINEEDFNIDSKTENSAESDEGPNHNTFDLERFE